MTAFPDGRATWDALLDAARFAHVTHPKLQALCPFPTDITPQDVVPVHFPPAQLMQDDPGLFTDKYVALRDAFVAGSPTAHWRETYRNTDLGDDFMDRFGCYCLIGDGGPFASRQMWAWVVYMPARLWYTWHHHPAEEMYLTLAGEAEFLRHGETNEVLRAGETSIHASNQPHAMQTHDHPVMAYVIWRNGFDTAPVLTPE